METKSRAIQFPVQKTNKQDELCVHEGGIATYKEADIQAQMEKSIDNGLHMSLWSVI